MAGFQFQQLPAAGEVSPRSTLEREIQTGRQGIQKKFELAWNTINSNARFLGRTKHQAMLRQLHADAKQEMLQFNQQAQQQTRQLEMIDQISAAGGITPEKTEELKAGMVYGRDVASAMYPKEKSIPQQFGELDAYSNRIAGDLEQFRVSTGETRPSRLGVAAGFISPLAGAISVYRGVSRAKKAAKKGPVVQIFDVALPAKDTKGKPVKDKFGDPVMGNWRDAEPEEVERYQLLKAAKRGVAAEKSKLLGQPDTKRRLAQPGTKGGTFGDKVAASYKTPTQQQNDPLGLFE